MSHVDETLLAQYNSLLDPHLAGYFNNTRMRKHLVKTGLIRRNGEIVSENTYRLNMARKEHKKHVRDLLAQAIVHKTLDIERNRQVAIRKKLEEIAKIELVRRVRTENSHKGDEDVLPYLTPRSKSQGGSRRGSRPSTAQSYGSRGGSRPSTAHSRGGSAKGRRSRPRSGSLGSDVVTMDEDGVIISPRDRSRDRSGSYSGSEEGRRSSAGRKSRSGKKGKKSKYPTGELDDKHLYALDQHTLREYKMAQANVDSGRGPSPYVFPQYPPDVVPAPPPKRGGNRRRIQPTDASGRPVRPRNNKGSLMLHRTEPAMKHQERVQTLCEVSVHYFGSNLNLDYEKFDPRDEILVSQQHCGGNTLPVFKEKILPGSDFTFTSRRHRGYPFGLTLYVNGVEDCRLSTCCEYKHAAGTRLGGKQGHFGIVGIEGAAPCYKCQMNESEKNKDEKKKKKKKKETKKEEDDNNLTVEVKKHDRDTSRTDKKEESEFSDSEDDNNAKVSVESDDETPRRKERKMTKYKITVLTGDVQNAGTDSDVFCNIIGSDGETGEKKLDDKKDNFERNATDEFTVEKLSVGTVKKITLRIDDSGIAPGWYINKVTVTDSADDKAYEFNCNTWIAKDEGDGKLEKTFTCADANDDYDDDFEKDDSASRSSRSSSRSSRSSRSRSRSSSSGSSRSPSTDRSARGKKEKKKTATKEKKPKPVGKAAENDTPPASARNGPSSPRPIKQNSRTDDEVNGNTSDNNSPPASVRDEHISQEPIKKEKYTDLHKVGCTAEDDSPPTPIREESYARQPEYEYGCVAEDESPPASVREESNFRLPQQTGGGIAEDESPPESVTEEPHYPKSIERESPRPVGNAAEDDSPPSSVREEPSSPKFIPKHKPVGNAAESDSPPSSVRDETETPQTTEKRIVKFRDDDYKVGSIAEDDSPPTSVRELPQSTTEKEKRIESPPLSARTPVRKQSFTEDSATSDSSPDSTDSESESDKPGYAPKDKSANEEEVGLTTTNRDTASDINSQKDDLNLCSIRPLVEGKTRIELTSMSLSPEQVDELSDVIRENGSTESMVLRNSSINDGAINKLAQAFSTTPPTDLQMLNLNCCQLTENGVKDLTQIIRAKPDLEFLLLHGNPLGDSGVGQLVDCLMDTHNIRTPDHLKVQPEEYKAIQATAKNVVHDVMQAVLKSNSANSFDSMKSTESTKALVQSMEEKQLREANLNGTGLKLKLLDLGDCDLTTEGAEHVAKLIQMNTCMESLSLAGNRNIGTEGWSAISEALKTNTNLKTLFLEYSNLGDSRISALYEGLKDNTSVTTIDLAGNKIGEQGGATLVKLVNENKCIQDITLQPGNGISDERMQTINQVLQSRNGLA